LARTSARSPVAQQYARNTCRSRSNCMPSANSRGHTRRHSAAAAGLSIAGGSGTAGDGGARGLLGFLAWWDGALMRGVVWSMPSVCSRQEKGVARAGRCAELETRAVPPEGPGLMHPVPMPVQQRRERLRSRHYPRTTFGPARPHSSPPCLIHVTHPRMHAS
jgi:hypothetical protein